MPIFSMYFKIVRSHAKVCCIYVAIFLSIFFIFSMMDRSGNGETAFTSTKVDYVLEDLDQSTLSKSLSTYLSAKHHPVEVKMDEESIKDAMFFEKMQVYIQIPAHFEADMMEGKKPQILIKQKPDYAAGMVLIQQLNTYLGSVHSYLSLDIGMDMENTLQAVEQDQAKQIEVQMANSQDVSGKTIGLSMYFNYLAYILMALFFVLGGTILTSINDKAIRMRNLISPISNVSFNLQLFGASTLSAIGLWVFFMIALQCMMPNAVWNEKGMYFMINSLIFLVVSMGITYMITNLLAGSDHAEEKVNGMSNVLCLGMCFLGGVFIPQALLSEGVKLVGSFLPTFWYVKAINEIVTIQQFSGDAFLRILQCFGIQLLFAIAFFVLAIFISHMKTSTHAIDANDLGDTHL